MELAAEQFRIGAELAGDDWGFLQDAGDVLLENEYWLAAVEMYLQVIEVEEVRSDKAFGLNFQNALFHAAKNPEAEPLLYGYEAQDVPREIGPAILFAARARYELFVDNNPEISQETLSLALERFGDFPVLQLVQAELFIETGEVELAQTILDELKNGTPLWIRAHARALLNYISN
jgi:hypothetical protein